MRTGFLLVVFCVSALTPAASFAGEMVGLLFPLFAIDEDNVLYVANVIPESTPEDSGCFGDTAFIWGPCNLNCPWYICPGDGTGNDGGYYEFPGPFNGFASTSSGKHAKEFAAASPLANPARLPRKFRFDQSLLEKMPSIAEFRGTSKETPVKWNPKRVLTANSPSVSRMLQVGNTEVPINVFVIHPQSRESDICPDGLIGKEFVVGIEVDQARPQTHSTKPIIGSAKGQYHATFVYNTGTEVRPNLVTGIAITNSPLRTK